MGAVTGLVRCGVIIIGACGGLAVRFMRSGRLAMTRLDALDHGLGISRFSQ